MQQRTHTTNPTQPHPTNLPSSLLPHTHVHTPHRTLDPTPHPLPLPSHLTPPPLPPLSLLPHTATPPTSTRQTPPPEQRPNLLTDPAPQERLSSVVLPTLAIVTRRLHTRLPLPKGRGGEEEGGGSEESGGEAAGEARGGRGPRPSTATVTGITGTVARVEWSGRFLPPP